MKGPWVHMSSPSRSPLPPPSPPTPCGTYTPWNVTQPLKTPLLLNTSAQKAELTTLVRQPLSRIRLFAIPWAIASTTELFRQEYWSRLPFPSPGDLSDSGTEPGSPTLQADSLLSESSGRREDCKCTHKLKIGLPCLTCLHSYLEGETSKCKKLPYKVWG